jgi:hypothetical protein
MLHCGANQKFSTDLMVSSNAIRIFTPSVQQGSGVMQIEILATNFLERFPKRKYIYCPN